MITTEADDQKRVMLPNAKPGQVYAIQENTNGSFTLSVVEVKDKAKLKCRLAKEDGFTVAVPAQPINEQAIVELLADFP